MNEKIISIEEVLNENGMDGYAVQTDAQCITVLIGNTQSCCENWGYLSTPDELSGYVGAQLLDIQQVDTALNVLSVNTNHSDQSWVNDYAAGDIIFVNFVTDRGVFQLAVYNAHNGYYGHSVKITSAQLTIGEYL